MQWYAKRVGSLNACMKGPFAFRPPEKPKSVIDFRFLFFNFEKQLGKQNTL